MRKEAHSAKATVHSPLPKVSVVDDDPDVRTLFKDLADSGHFVLVAAYSNGREALAELPHSLPDVVFMDIHLPDMSGIECTKRLTTILPNLLVVVLTGHADQQIFVRALMAGASGFLTKPCSIQETLAAINDMLVSGAVVGRMALTYLQRIIRQLSRLDPGWNLTDREKQIFVGIFEGKSDKEIADALGIGPATVHTHMTHLFDKFSVHSREELIAKFLQP